MALYTNLPIYKSCYQLTNTVAPIVAKFPKQYRFNLGNKLLDMAIDITVQIFTINSSYEKESIIQNFLTPFQVFITSIRLAKDLNLISIQQFAHITKITTSIEKQATGWKKSVTKI